MPDLAEPFAGDKKFAGFPAGTTLLTEIPEPFFTDLLPIIDDLAELKVTLYAIWYIQQLDGDIRYMQLSEMQKDTILKQMFTIGDEEDAFLKILQTALQKAVTRGTLLVISEEKPPERYYFINTPRSQAILEGYHKGEWHPKSVRHQPVSLDLGKPDVFKLYEQNIGLITPMIADQLKLASDEFPLDWIDDAMRIAVENNVRRWSYINRILQTWQERGRNAKN